MASVIRCIYCLQSMALPELSSWYSSLTCAKCGKHFGKRGTVPDFAPHIDVLPGNGPVQQLMNTKFFARFYESPVWRPLLASWGAGEPAQAEVDIVMSYLEEVHCDVALDLACGTGHYARAIAKRYPQAHIHCMDISPGMLRSGRHRAQREGISQLRFMGADIYKLPVNDHSVDLVNCGGALHLFQDMEGLWAEVARVLKVGGRFSAMSIPLLSGPLAKVQKYMMAQKRATFFSPAILEQQLRDAGFFNFQYDIRRAVLTFTAKKGGLTESEPS